MRRPDSMLLAAALLGGCTGSPSGGVVCTEELRHGVHVEVRDSLSGEAAARGAEGWVQEGSYRDSLRHLSDEAMAGAPERRGRYEVTIRKAGYREWRASGVRVTGDQCHVRTVELKARLVRAP